jgi:hypothetical protein
MSDLQLHRGAWFQYVYDFGAHWACDIRLKAIRPLAPRGVYPLCIGGQCAAPPEDCWGAWAYMEWLDQYRLYPPLEAMGVVANAISILLEADPQTSVRVALGDLDELREAVDCLETYQAFQPEHFDRGDINRRLHAWGQEEGDVPCR